MQEKTIQDSLLPGLMAAGVTAGMLLIMLLLESTSQPLSTFGILAAFLALMLSFLAPLPLLVVGFETSMNAIWIGIIAGMAISALFLPFPLVLKFFSWVGLSSIFITRLARQQIKEHGRPDLYRLLTLCLTLSIIFQFAFLIALNQDIIAIEKDLIAKLAENIKTTLATYPGELNLGEVKPVELATSIILMQWPVNAILQYLSLVISTLLAVHILSKKNYLPPFQFSMLLIQLPLVTTLLALIALPLVAHDGLLKRPALVLVALIGTIAVAIGYHLVHLLVRGTKWQTPSLVFIYGFTFVSGFLLLPFMFILGLFDTFLGFRHKIMQNQSETINKSIKN